MLMLMMCITVSEVIGTGWKLLLQMTKEGLSKNMRKGKGSPWTQVGARRCRAIKMAKTAAPMLLSEAVARVARGGCMRTMYRLGLQLQRRSLRTFQACMIHRIHKRQCAQKRDDDPHVQELEHANIYEYMQVCMSAYAR
jgi:hypothetical protein